jgi:hypothetical protein
LLQELDEEPLDVALVQVPTRDVGVAVELGAAAPECSMTSHAARRSMAARNELSRTADVFIANDYRVVSDHTILFVRRLVIQ